jgi:hypothetical protein
MSCPKGATKSLDNWVGAAFTVLGCDVAGASDGYDGLDASRAPAPRIVLAAWRRHYLQATLRAHERERQQRLTDPSFRPVALTPALALRRSEPTRALALTG